MTPQEFENEIRDNLYKVYKAGYLDSDDAGMRAVLSGIITAMHMTIIFASGGDKEWSIETTGVLADHLKTKAGIAFDGLSKLIADENEKNENE